MIFKRNEFVGGENRIGMPKSHNQKIGVGTIMGDKREDTKK